MILCSDKSTLIGQYKCGTKGMEYLERKVLTHSNTNTNNVYGYDIIKMLSNKHIPEKVHSSLSDYNLTYLTNLIYNENKLPFVIFVRDPYRLYKAQIIQSIREFCKRNPSIDVDIALTSTNESEKNSFFKKLVNIFPRINEEIYTDMHYCFHSFNEILNLVLYLQSERLDIFNNLILLNLDNYDTSQESLDLLCEFNIMSKEYINSFNSKHSTSSSYLPEPFSPNAQSPIFNIPFLHNFESLNLLSKLFPYKNYSQEKLKPYRIGNKTLL